MRSGQSLTDLYHESLRGHGYEPDAAQLAAVAQLEDLRRRLNAAPRGWLDRLRGAARRERSQAPVRGVYLWGGVGRGKTFLMDLFHAHAGVTVRREHFHRFMKDIHARLAQLRNREEPLDLVAADLARDCQVLCLDELFVADIADAMILSGLFGSLLERGVTLVFTSNTPPAGLYRDGLQRSRFLPAIALLEQHTELVNVDAGIDYRLRQLERAPLYFDAGSADADLELAARFAAIAGEPGRENHEIEIEGRSIRVRRSTGDVIWFDFTDICDGPRSQTDYVEIARDFHAVLVSDVPRFDATRDNEARRFIALVDEFYDRNVKLVLSAQVPVAELYAGERLAFEFERTRSRLIEMQSHDYLSRPHRA
jgi:cell division protein ZapE